MTVENIIPAVGSVLVELEVAGGNTGTVIKVGREVYRVKPGTQAIFNRASFVELDLEQAPKVFGVLNATDVVATVV